MVVPFFRPREAASASSAATPASQKQQQQPQPPTGTATEKPPPPSTLVNSSFFAPPPADSAGVMAEARARDAEQKKQFAELQGYIDELTEDKYALERALQNHARLMETLHEENMALTRQYNTQGQQVGGLQERVAKYESELGAQAMALETLTSQREEAQRGNTDAVERAQLLAAEVVALEEKCLALTSERLKAKHELDRMAEELDRATRTAKQVQPGL